MNQITVLLTASGSQFAPGIIKCLKSNGEREIRVIGADMSNDPTNKYLVDVFYQIPAVKAENYVQTILDICEKEKVQILLPQMSAELPFFLENLERFEAIGTRVSMTCGENVNIANNKLRLFEFMREHGIPTPKFCRADSVDSFEQALKEIGYPEKAVCVKLPDLSGSRGIRVIDSSKSKYDIFANQKPSSLVTTREDMLQTLLQAPVFPELLVMEYMPGDEYTIGVLADCGEVCYIAGRRSPVMLMSIAQESIVEKDSRAYAIARSVVEALKLDGNIGMDFMYDETGKLQLMEINPRIDATVSVFAAAGLNLPYLRVKQLLGEPLPTVDIQYGTRVKRRYLETFTDKNGERINF